MCAGAHGAHNSMSDILELELQAYVNHQIKVVWQWNPGLLQEQQVFWTTEPCLQTQSFCSWISETEEFDKGIRLMHTFCYKPG